MCSGAPRTLAEINDRLRVAKISENDILPTSQSISFIPDKLYNKDYYLLELDQHLQDQIEQGQKLYIKGGDDENVVLCTEERTYDVVVGETSNSLLITKQLKFFEDLKNTQDRNFENIEVAGIFYEYLLPTQCKPHLKKMMNLLKKSVYKGPEHEYQVKEEDLCSFEDLNKTVQGSRKELKEALEKLHVITINDKVRLLDVEYHFRVLSYMLKLIDENSWNLDEIDYEETLNSLRDVIPENVLISLFDKYTVESKIVDSLQLYSYKEPEVCRFFAQVLLYAAEKFNLDEFLQAWKQSVPEGMEPSEDLLHGIAIIDRKSEPNIISAFSEEDLPEDINTRFQMLFKAKEKWTVPEITPYIERLATPKMDVNALLAKYARASKAQGVKCYSAKHGK